MIENNVASRILWQILQVRLRASAGSTADDRLTSLVSAANFSLTLRMNIELYHRLRPQIENLHGISCLGSWRLRPHTVKQVVTPHVMVPQGC